MGTRSTIAIEYADGTVEQVYCHWDGYIAHNGKILFENYSDPFKLQELINGGGISSLGTEIGVKHPFGPHGSEQDKIDYDAAVAAGATTFYGRDRGEDVSKESFWNFDMYRMTHQREEYAYILRNIDGKAVWFVAKGEAGFNELSNYMKEMETV